jgi:hypothetical protein
MKSTTLLSPAKKQVPKQSPAKSSSYKPSPKTPKTLVHANITPLRPTYNDKETSTISTPTTPQKKSSLRPQTPQHDHNKSVSFEDEKKGRYLSVEVSVTYTKIVFNVSTVAQY